MADSPPKDDQMDSVAVIVAAYNAESTIVAAIESILRSKVPCRVFVADDCSQTPVESVLSHLKDRVEIIRMERNGGPAAARNAALDGAIKAGFTYAAIQDADDLSEPDRLEKQLAFMQAHPHVGACGTWTCLLDDAFPPDLPQDLRRKIDDVRRTRTIGLLGTWTQIPDERTGKTFYLFSRVTAPRDVRNSSFFNIGLSHTSVMMRCSALQEVGLYATAYPAAEDYELMRRIGRKYDLANIPECMVHYRVTPGSISQSRRRRQLYDRLLIQLKYFEAAEWRAWIGVAKTLASLVIPRQRKEMSVQREA